MEPGERRHLEAPRHLLSTMGPVRDFGGISSIGYRTIASLFLSSDALLLWLVILCGEGLRVRRYAQLTPTARSFWAKSSTLKQSPTKNP